MPEDQPRDDSDLEEALEETFPASDAPANTVETGIQVGEPTSVERDRTDDPRK
jgi:hypothetical protein